MSGNLLIFGPTASGKSALALEIAHKNGAEIVNMDSMQIYKGIGIISAAPSLEDFAAIRHHLFLHIDPKVTFSTGEYIKQASAIINDAKIRGKSLIFVGGTGLYAHALTHGIIEIPQIPIEIRTQMREFVQADIIGSFSRLGEIDPIIAKKIEPQDSQRIARALEVYEATNRPLSEWQAMPQTPILGPNEWRGVKLLPNREIVHENIKNRFKAMMSNGGLEEVEALWKLGLSRELPALKALGIPHLMEFFDGKIDKDAAIDLAIIATRQYAKRQYTWANNRAADWQTIKSFADLN